MDVQSITPYPYQAEKKSNLVGESAKLEVSCLDSRQKNHEENRAEQEDKQANHFGLDLELPHPDHYLPETVDFPSSPSAMMKYRVADDDELSHSPEDHRPEHNEPVTDSEDEESLRAVIDTNNSVRLKKEEESSDSANVSDTEEYFEDFHLPMTHQNSMSTRRSFMRKIKAVDIRVPDADRIEGIVKSGQLNRHGSIRRKIVPQPQDFINDSLYSDQSETSPAKFTSTPNGTFAELDLANDTMFMSEQQDHDCILMPFANGDVDKETSELPAEMPIDNGSLAEMAPLDEATLLKIMDCLNSEKVRDIYTLGSTLQDLLSTAEVEEIVSNSHRYSEVISRDILMALTERRTPEAVDPLAKNKVASVQVSSAAVSSAPPDLIDSQDISRNPDRRETAKIKKRLSATDDSARMDDDSDDDINLNAVCPVIEEENVLVCEDGGQPDAASGSDSLFSSPIDGWDFSPEGIRNSEGLQSSLNERMDSSRTKPDLIPETSAQEEKDEERNWRSVVIMGLERKIDLKVIEPYKKVLSHGGYQGNDCQTAVIVFSACFLPDRSRVDYDYVMEHLFLYVLTTLDQLVAEDYVLIYFHGATPKSCIPRFSWVKNCYQMIDRRLRKNLKRLYLVHPTLWLKAAVLMCRPFISTKFSRKIVYIPNLPSLSAELPMDHVCIPDRVKQLEFTLMIQDIKRRKGLR
ncbi:protein prune homolog 2-like isoform X2 [Daphnia magna]|uniref:protein prune homolog 2-like isoform X2 n=1 Tax=Daphnia magna TaxID=35525 RepID=UPI001E1BD011|nr:protein prune homolog 2-like isoform X2 [Daphnia magna]